MSERIFKVQVALASIVVFTGLAAIATGRRLVLGPPPTWE